MVSTNNENLYRVSYLDGVWDVLRVTKRFSAEGPWLDALDSWRHLPLDISPAPPGPDGTIVPAGCGSFGDTWQRTRCRGYSQGVEAALLTVKPSLSPSVCAQMQKWRDQVLAWRNKNSSRVRRGLPSPPAAPMLVNP